MDNEQNQEISVPKWGEKRKNIVSDRHNHEQLTRAEIWGWGDEKKKDEPEYQV